MKMQDKSMTRKERNLQCAKRNYMNKKREREDLEKEHEGLVRAQKKLLIDISYLTECVTMMQSFLPEHSKACSVKKEHHPKRKWNETYQQQQQQLKQQQQHPHPKVKVHPGGPQSVPVF